ncbi:MAG: hypothetical protein HFJ08_03800 [Lachnospiraceae bacterium]|nr:hypothetical protein [Lachnospiraceae bacterium]
MEGIRYFPVAKLYLMQTGLKIKQEKLPEQVKYDIRLSDSYLSEDKEDNAKNIEPDLEVIVYVYDFRMTYTEILAYIEQNVLPERLKEYENDMRNHALVANGITYIQRAEKNKKYKMPANVTSVE